MVLCLALTPHSSALADDNAADAAHLSDGAFSLLNSLNAKGGAVAPLAGPVAAFAADAQALSQSLAAGDRTGASQQMAALEADRATVDGAIGHGGKLPEWEVLKRQLDALAKAVPPSAAAASPPAASVTGPSSAAVAPASSSVSSASTSEVPSSSLTTPAVGPMPAESSFGSPPKAVIDSRRDDGGMLRVKGYLEGTALQNAGIYQDGQLLKPIRITPVVGEQRLDFDLGLGDAGPGMSIRVYDAHGRSAEVFVSPPDTANAAPNLGNSAAAGDGIEVDRASRSAGGRAAAGTNTATIGTAEIPSHGVMRPSPSKRHTIQSHLGDIQIDVVAVRQIAVTPPMYEVIGVIQGRGVTRAGIYIDGRLAARIPSSDGATMNNLDERFVMDGREVTVRAFGVGNHYTERPVDLSTAVAMANPPPLNPALIGAPPAAMAPAMTGPGTLSIQLTGVTQLTPSMILVNGVIAGRNLRAAGLYQNGMLVQSIPVGNGSGGVLGSLLSNFTSRTMSFSVRFNPQMGPAMIRASDASGSSTEQPVAAGGLNAYMGAPATTNLYGGAAGGSGW